MEKLQGRRGKVKPLGEVKRTENKFVADTKRDLNIQTALAIVASSIGIIVCLCNLKLTIECEDLKKEKEALEELTETQSSMISDLEANCKDLYIEIENLKFGGNE